jgi:site-specific recombinase XerD
LSLTDITDLLAAADGHTPNALRDRALLEVMYAAGVRVSEAHGLGVRDMDLEEKTLLVRGKGNKQRLVVIGDPARAALERYLRDGRPSLIEKRRSGAAEDRQRTMEDGSARARARSVALSQHGETRARRQVSDALFVNKIGERLSQRAIQILVRKYALAAGIDARVHPHLLRHTFATHLLDGGAELRVVQELLGHANPNTTQIYLHVTEERQRAVMDSSLDELAQVESARRSLSRARRGGTG